MLSSFASLRISAAGSRSPPQHARTGPAGTPAALTPAKRLNLIGTVEQFIEQARNILHSSNGVLVIDAGGAKDGD